MYIQPIPKRVITISLFTTTTSTRIALVTWSLPGGGVEIYLLRLGEYLVRHGYQVDIITTEEPGEWFDRIEPRGIRGVPIEGRQSSTHVQHALRIARQLVNGNYRVIFLNNAYAAQTALNILPDNVVAIPVLHGDIDLVYQKYCANPTAWNVAVAVSPKVQSEAQRRVPNRPVLFIPNGVHLPSVEAWQQRRRFGYPLKLAYIGRLDHEMKGIFFLPDILDGCLNRGMDVQLTVAGDGPDGDALIQAFKERGSHQRVVFLGKITIEQVYKTYLDAHVMLMPSFSEGLPTVLLEAQACGCVPIASFLREITDVVVTDRETGLLVDIGDVEGFVNAIAELYHHPDRWNQCSTAAHERSVGEFSVEAMGQSYQRLIQDCLAGRYPLLHGKRGWFPLDITMLSFKDFIPFWARRSIPKWINRNVRYLLKQLTGQGEILFLVTL